MQITGQEYCKKCHKYTEHTTTLDPGEPLRCSICKTAYRSKELDRARKAQTVIGLTLEQGI